MSIMNPAHLENARRFRENFAAAVPFPHVVIDNFLSEDFARGLFRNFPRFDSGRAKNEYGEKGGKSTREDVENLGDPYIELTKFFSSSEFLDWTGFITDIPGLIFDASYLGGGTHENLPGQDLSLHVDFNYHPIQGWHRRLNLLLYLNPEWEDAWGGALELWENPWDPPSRNKIVKISPVWNRMVLFSTTEKSWHGFEAIKIPPEKSGVIESRKSFALYLYSTERPAHEIRAMHSTVYYERPLPETIKAGEVISKEDFDEMVRLTKRRDEMLKLLYRREEELNWLNTELSMAVFRHMDKIRRLTDQLQNESKPDFS